MSHTGFYPQFHLSLLFVLWLAELNTFLKKLYNLHKVVSPYPWVLHPQIKLCLDFSMYLLNLGMQRVDIEIQLYCAILCKGLELPWVLVSMEVWAHPLQTT